MHKRLLLSAVALSSTATAFNPGSFDSLAPRSTYDDEDVDHLDALLARELDSLMIEEYAEMLHRRVPTGTAKTAKTTQPNGPSSTVHPTSEGKCKVELLKDPETPYDFVVDISSGFQKEWVDAFKETQEKHFTVSYVSSKRSFMWLYRKDNLPSLTQQRLRNGQIALGTTVMIELMRWCNNHSAGINRSPTEDDKKQLKQLIVQQPENV